MWTGGVKVKRHWGRVFQRDTDKSPRQKRISWAPFNVSYRGCFCDVSVLLLLVDQVD